MQVTIQDATMNDAAELLEVQKLAFRGQAVLYDDLTLPPLHETREELRRDLGTHVILKAVAGGMIVGSVRGYAEKDTCRISRLAVHPEHQNKGIGKSLMQAIEKKFCDALRYELYTGHKSEKSLALYRKLGYREFARRPQSENVILVCMEKTNKATR